MTEVTATEFRRNLFNLLDQALETGEAVVIRRNGKRLVVREEPEPKVDCWTRYEAWVAEARARGEAEPASDLADPPAEPDGVSEGLREWEAEWDAFRRHEEALDRLEREGRTEEFEQLVKRGF